MTQPATKADVIQIEPGTTGVRTISRDSTTNGLLFKDPAFISGLRLEDLAGLQTVTGVYLVGRGGGAPYTTIQDALDDVPNTSSALLPSVILVNAGAYTENINVVKDGVSIVGLGQVEIVNADPGNTLTIQEDVVIPRKVTLQNLTITNTDTGACVFIDGSNTHATGTLTVLSTLTAGDTITIGGVELLGVGGTRTSGSDNFNATLGTVNALAAEIATALADPANSFAASITNTVASAVVSLRAVVAGSAGNTITLESSTENISLSGATLTDGGGAGSLVGADGIVLQDCNLKAVDAADYSLRVNIANAIRIIGGDWSTSTYPCVIAQVGYLSASNVWGMPDMEISYNTSLDLPYLDQGNYILSNLVDMGGLLSLIQGDGSLRIVGSSLTTFAMGGDRFVNMENSTLSSVDLSDTVAATFRKVTYGEVSFSGTPTLDVDVFQGSLTFEDSLAETFTFPIPQPDTGYSVYIDCPVLGIVPQVTEKSTTDITIETGTSLTGTIRFTVMR